MAIIELQEYGEKAIYDLCVDHRLSYLQEEKRCMTSSTIAKKMQWIGIVMRRIINKKINQKKR